MNYYIIYDGNCNLCVTFVQQLERVEKGKLFQYIPMQDLITLERLGVTAEDCELGMMLIDVVNPDAVEPTLRERRWQGSDAAEEIAKLLSGKGWAIDLYRWIPGLKWLFDRGYIQIRDHRYAWFGSRKKTYESLYQFKSCDRGGDPIDL